MAQLPGRFLQASNYFLLLPFHPFPNVSLRGTYGHTSHTHPPQKTLSSREDSPSSSSQELRMWTRVGDHSAESLPESGRNPPKTSWSQKSRNRSWRSRQLVRINSYNSFFPGFERKIRGKGSKVRGIKARHKESLGLSCRETGRRGRGKGKQGSDGGKKKT